MHSHLGMQEQSLLTAPQIAYSAEDMRVDRQEVVLMLHDFSSRTPDELLAGPTKSDRSQSAMPTSGRARNRPRSIRRVHVTLRRGGRSLDERYEWPARQSA